MMETDVLVVGAGVAGLTTAIKLKKSNKHLNVTVVEASDMIGGRVRRGTFPKSKLGFDSGASVFHGKSAPYLYVTQRRKDLQLELTREEDFDIVIWQRGKLCKLTDTKVHKEYVGYLEKLVDLDEYEVKALDLETVEDWFLHMGASEEVIALADADIGCDHCLPIRNMGLLEYWRFDNSWKDDECNYVPSGCSEGISVLITELVKETEELNVKIITGFRVQHIEKERENDDLIIVRPEIGSVYQTRRVVVTVSIGVLQAGVINFTPSLPRDTSQAIAKIRMGRYLKVSVLLNQVLQEEGVIIDDGPVKWFWSAGIETPKVISALVEPPKQDWTPTELVEGFQRQLQKMFSNNELEVLEWDVTDWSLNPSVLGTYSVPTPGDGDSRAILRRSLWGDTLFFAGEGTEEAYSAMQSAWTSGERVANGILESLQADMD